MTGQRRSATIDTLSKGMRVGRFEIAGRLGRGGMGEVYRARDRRLGRDMAIKVISRQSADDARTAARFEREARAASALAHPGIVTVFDVGEHDGHPYIVMELVKGESLRAWLDRDRPSLRRVLDIAGCVAEALAAAHGQGIVHRDLKPENVLVTADGLPKLADFGLAEFSAPPAMATASVAPTEELLTRQGTVLGTLGYMAPECLSGDYADHRSDQFSFGVVLYEMLAGHRPFSGRTLPEVLASTLRDEPPPLEPAVPDPLAEIVGRCLAKSPDDRFQGSERLAAALRSVREGFGSAERPESTAIRPLERAGLPASLTPMIGREQEIASLQELLGDPAVRLVTITGVGGSGKTRLALRVAEKMARDSLRRVVFVALAGVQEPELVPSAINRELGIRAGPEQTELDAAIHELSSGGATLLLLDNFEHLMEASAVVGELLAACPLLEILVTSREVLRLLGEHDFALAPLRLPDSGSVDEAAEAPAVALFVERARASSPDFALREENVEAVAELCRRLEGLPLALELAAARSRILSPQAMLDRLTSRLQLRAPVRGLPRRQKTLRSTIDWSHDLLDETEQIFFRRLGVFVAGFTLEAAQAVVDPFENLELDVVDGVSSLVDKSLVAPLSAVAGEERYGMLETVREYALERLGAADETARTARAHAAYQMILAESGAGVLASEASDQWIARFDAEHDNLRTALAWLIAEGEVSWGLRLAVALFHYWERAEHLEEGRRRFDELLGLPLGGLEAPLRARALFCSGVLAHTQNDEEETLQRHSESLEIYRELGDLWGQAEVSNSLSIVAKPKDARAHAEDALAIWEQLENEPGYARSLSNLGKALRRCGDFEAAREAYDRAAELFDRLGDRVSRAWAINHTGDLARECGEIDVAEELYRDAYETFRQVGDSWGMGSSQADLARLERQRGEIDRAEGLYCSALRRFHRLGHRRGVARLLEALASLAVEREEGERSLLLGDAARALRERIGAPLTDDERRQRIRERTRASEQAGATAERITQRAGRLSLDRVVEEALRPHRPDSEGDSGDAEEPDQARDQE